MTNIPNNLNYQNRTFNPMPTAIRNWWNGIYNIFSPRSSDIINNNSLQILHEKFDNNSNISQSFDNVSYDIKPYDSSKFLYPNLKGGSKNKRKIPKKLRVTSKLKKIKKTKKILHTKKYLKTKKKFH